MIYKIYSEYHICNVVEIEADDDRAAQDKAKEILCSEISQSNINSEIYSRIMEIKEK